MKNVYLKIADKILPRFREVCKRGKCKHQKCECGHCQRNYHDGKNGECMKLNLDLTTCNCKSFNLYRKKRDGGKKLY